MRRRAYLGGLVSVGVAGCLGETPAPPNAGENSETKLNKPEIDVEGGEIVDVEDSFTVGVKVPVTVYNRSSMDVCDIEIFVDWVDKGGNILETDKAELMELKDGMHWQIEIEGGPNDLNPANYDLRIDYREGPSPTPSDFDIELTDSTITIESAEATVLVHNNSGKEKLAGAGVQFIDGSRLHAENSDYELVPAGKTWRFDAKADHNDEVERVDAMGAPVY